MPVYAVSSIQHGTSSPAAWCGCMVIELNTSSPSSFTCQRVRLADQDGDGERGERQAAGALLETFMEGTRKLCADPLNVLRLRLERNEPPFRVIKTEQDENQCVEFVFLRPNSGLAGRERGGVCNYLSGQCGIVRDHKCAESVA